MAKLALVYGMRLLPADEIEELNEAEIRLKNGKSAHVTMHLLEGGEKEIRAQLEQSLDAFFEFYPEIKELFLSRHLGIGIPPGTQLQAAAHPAQPFGGIRSALTATHRAQHGLAQTIRFNRSLGLFQKLFRYHRFRNQGLRRRPGNGDALALHHPTITVS